MLTRRTGTRSVKWTVLESNEETSYSVSLFVPEIQDTVIIVTFVTITIVLLIIKYTDYDRINEI